MATVKPLASGNRRTELDLCLVERPAAVVRTFERLRELRDLVEALDLGVVEYVHLTDIHVLTMAPGERNGHLVYGSAICGSAICGSARLAACSTSSRDSLWRSAKNA